MHGTSRFLSLLLAFLLCIAQINVPYAHARPSKKKNQIPDSIAQRIRAAHTIFLVNSGAPDVSFDQFHNSLQAWGHYQLADILSNADLVFALRTSATTSCSDSTDDKGVTSTSCVESKYFVLTIEDPENLEPLWVITYSADDNSRGKHGRNPFPRSIANLTSEVKLVAGQNLTAAETKSLSTHPYRSLILAIAIPGGIAATVFSIRGLTANKHCHPGVPCDVFGTTK